MTDVQQEYYKDGLQFLKFFYRPNRRIAYESLFVKNRYYPESVPFYLDRKIGVKAKRIRLIKV